MNYTPQDYGDLSGPPAERAGRWGEKVAVLPREVRRGRLLRAAGVDWVGLPGWKDLKDTQKVYANPNIDDQTLWSPRIDLFEEETGLIRVEVELPGVPKEDIGLELSENEQEGGMVLTVSALKPQKGKEKSGFYHVQERHYGRFFRQVRLPYRVEREHVRAHINNGVLHVHLQMKSSHCRIHVSSEDQQATAALPEDTGTRPSAT